MSLKILTWKLVMLCALLSGQRAQSIGFFDIRNMCINDSVCKFKIGDTLKTTRPGAHQSEIVFPAYPADKRLLVITVFKEYLNRTESLRGPFRATQIWNEIVTHLKVTVEVKRRRYKMRHIDNCFTGSDAVNVVLHYLLQDHEHFGVEICRDKAVKLCQTLMDRSVFESVSSRLSEGKRPVFEDSHGKLYKFIGVDYQSDTVMDESDDEDIASTSPGEERRNNQDLEHDIIGLGGIENDVIYNPILISKQGNMMAEVLQLQKGLKRKSSPLPGHQLNKVPRRYSYPEGMKLGENTGEILPEAYDEIWREVALRQLLTLVDVPILDGLLSEDKTVRKSNRVNLVIPNIHNYPRPANHNDLWVSSAFELLEHSPLGLSVLDSELRSPVSVSTKMELFTAIRKQYCQCAEPLLPERFIDLYLPILNLVLQEKDHIALKALQLLMILLPWQTIEEVQRLFKFMSVVSNDSTCPLEPQEENKIVVIKLFTDVLIQHPMISHNLAAVLVGFMITHSNSIFTIPKDVEDKVNYYLFQVKQGKLDPVIEESFCARLTPEEYCKQSEEATSQGLREMIDRILDDTQIPLKEKKIRLKQFQKSHPQICAQYFPDVL